MHTHAPCAHALSLATRAIVVLAVLASVHGLAVTFTGDVEVDFPASDPSVFVSVDSSSPIIYNNSGIIQSSGWDIRDIRYSYDLDSDTAYFGACVPLT